MPRLLAFGCSYTYGEGLDDCWVLDKEKPRDSPSSFAWPSLVAKELNRKVYNYGIPGASNKQIWYNILNKSFKQDDLIVILWTHFDRSCIIHDNGTTKRILPVDVKRKKRFSRIYYQEYWSSLDSMLDNFARMNLIDFYLKSKKIKVYHFAAEEKLYEPPHWSTINLINTNFNTCSIDLAKDKMHPGIESHKFLSNIILKEIKKDNGKF